MTTMTYEQVVNTLKTGHSFKLIRNRYLHVCTGILCKNCLFDSSSGCKMADGTISLCASHDVMAKVQQDYPEFFL